MGPLASLVSDRERVRVHARAARLYHGAGIPDGPGPPRPELSRRVCFAVAAIAPTLPYDRLSLLARYARWSIVLDDRLDRPDPDPRALRALRDAVVAVTAGRRAGAGRPPPSRRAGLVDPARLADPVPDELGRIIEELAGLDRTGGQAVARFGAALRDAVASGVWHALLGRAVIAGVRPPPTAEQYLAVAARTVNYRSFGYALLALGGDAGRGSAPGAGPGRDPAAAAVDRALWHGAGAVRLANDLRSVDRDRAEATLNVRQLRTAAGARVTGRWVRAGIDRRRRAHDYLLAALAPADGPAAQLLIRSLRLSVGVYRLGDLRGDEAA